MSAEELLALIKIYCGGEVSFEVLPLLPGMTRVDTFQAVHVSLDRTAKTRSPFAGSIRVALEYLYARLLEQYPDLVNAPRRQAGTSKS